MFLCFLFFPIPPTQMPFGKERGRERNKELASCFFPWLGSPDPGLPSTVPSSPAHSTPCLCHTSSPMSTCSFHFQGLVLSVCPWVWEQESNPFWLLYTVTHSDGSLITVISLPQAQAQMPIPLGGSPSSFSPEGQGSCDLEPIWHTSWEAWVELFFPAMLTPAICMESLSHPVAISVIPSPL